ncbi:hypothetical protein BJX66DRAFT_303339 [Aspergillus keveii]|uniref:Uncharacterized protein n=1 Tax=Aspergillus keveii TaxID=714993 RepID=A0ABR4G6S2_9EURO
MRAFCFSPDAQLPAPCLSFLPSPVGIQIVILALSCSRQATSILLVRSSLLDSSILRPFCFIVRFGSPIAVDIGRDIGFFGS